jgi:hypothetical protein
MTLKEKKESILSKMKELSAAYSTCERELKELQEICSHPVNQVKQITFSYPVFWECKTCGKGFSSITREEKELIESWRYTPHGTKPLQAVAEYFSPYGKIT